jgi:hypothetical protein
MRLIAGLLMPSHGEALPPTNFPVSYYDEPHKPQMTYCLAFAGGLHNLKTVPVTSGHIVERTVQFLMGPPCEFFLDVHSWR